MRLLYLQIEMLNLAGEWLPFVEPNDGGLVHRLTEAHCNLVKETGRDFGFDLIAWHEYLSERDDYNWANKHLSIKERIDKALSDPDWRAAVRQIEEAESEAP